MTTPSAHHPIRSAEQTSARERSGTSVDAAGDDPPRSLRGGHRGVLHAVPDRRAGRGAGRVVGPPGRRARPVGRRRRRRARGAAVGPRPDDGDAARPRAARPLRHADGRVMRAVAGFDATFSAPKSLSVWWALTGDHRLLDAHDAAVTRRARPPGAVRVDDPDPLERRPPAPRHARSDDGDVPPDHVAGRRPADPHPRRDLRQGPDRRRALAGARRPLPEAPPADARRPLPVGAARRAHPPLRRRLGADRATARPRSPASPTSCSPSSRSAPPRSTRRSPTSSPTSATARVATRPGGNGPR